jgi:hypothetical protein
MIARLESKPEWLVVGENVIIVCVSYLSYD